MADVREVRWEISNIDRYDYKLFHLRYEWYRLMFLLMVQYKLCV